MSRPQFYIQDTRSTVGNNVLWWAKGDNGYTTDLNKAEIYTLDEAQRKYNGRPSDLPWPKDYVDTLTHPAVDMQYLRREDAQKCDPEGALGFYVQASRRYDGNDVLWRPMGGGAPTADLGAAQVHTLDEAHRVMGSESMESTENTIWPKAYIDEKVRLAVSIERLKQTAAFRRSGIVFVKPAKAKREMIKCGECGRFMSQAQLWAGACPKCGADNRP